MDCAKSIFTNAYTTDQNNNLNTWLYKDIYSNVNYCEVSNTVKIISFVLVACSVITIIIQIKKTRGLLETAGEV